MFFYLNFERHILETVQKGHKMLLHPYSPLHLFCITSENKYVKASEVNFLSLKIMSSHAETFLTLFFNSSKGWWVIFKIMIHSLFLSNDTTDDDLCTLVVSYIINFFFPRIYLFTCGFYSFFCFCHESLN